MEKRQSPAHTGRASEGRLLELDVLRAIAAVAVVVIHISAPILESSPAGTVSFWLAALGNQWARFAIPAFVFISGLALFYAYGDRELKPFDFWRRRLTAIGIPYLLWTVFYVLLAARVEARPAAQIPSTLGTALVRGTGMYHLYFIVLILQFYLLFPAVRPLARWRGLPAAVLAALALQFWLMQKAAPFGGSWGQQPHFFAVVLQWQDRLFPWWLGYFAAGAWAATRLNGFRAGLWRWGRGISVVSGLLLVVLMWEFNLRAAQPNTPIGWATSGFRPLAYVYSLVANVAILAVGLRLASLPRLPRPIAEVARHSFGIYLVHPFFLSLWQYLLQRFHLTMGPSLWLAATFAIVFSASYLTARLLSRLPYGHLVVGKG